MGYDNEIAPRTRAGLPLLQPASDAIDAVLATARPRLARHLAEQATRVAEHRYKQAMREVCSQ